MSLHTFTQHPRSRLGLQTPHHVFSCETEEATSLPGPRLGPADLSSVTRMLPAALCGHVGCILSRGTPQRKPVGAGVPPRLSWPSYLPTGAVTITRKGPTLITSCCSLVRERSLPPVYTWPKHRTDKTNGRLIQHGHIPERPPPSVSSEVPSDSWLLWKRRLACLLMDRQPKPTGLKTPFWCPRTVSPMGPC